MRRGLTEADVQAALGDLDVADLPAKTVMALRLADLLTGPRPAVTADDYATLREELEEGEILELAAAIAVGSGWQRMIEAFEIRPDHWSEATPLPWQATQ